MATPIGNLADLTGRAAAVLREVPVVVAEDTRRTRALLSHLGIGGKRLLSIDAHATERDLDRVVELLGRGESVALVTDAGTPAVSDPGAALVRRAAQAGFRVEPVPGPSAVTAAASVSGLVDGPFLFLGFPPRKGKERRRWLESATGSPWPVIAFEAPGRTAETLAELAALAPEREACACRELTKSFEEVRRGSLTALAAAEGEWRGEVVLVLGRAPERAAGVDEADVDRALRDELGRGLGARDAARQVAAALGVGRRVAYQRALALGGPTPAPRPDDETR